MADLNFRPATADDMSSRPRYKYAPLFAALREGPQVVTAETNIRERLYLTARTQHLLVSVVKLDSGDFLVTLVQK